MALEKKREQKAITAQRDVQSACLACNLECCQANGVNMRGTVSDVVVGEEEVQVSQIWCADDPSIDGLLWLV